MANCSLEIVGRRNIILTEGDRKYVLAYNKDTDELEWQPVGNFIIGSVESFGRLHSARILTGLARLSKTNGNGRSKK